VGAPIQNGDPRRTGHKGGLKEMKGKESAKLGETEVTWEKKIPSCPGTKAEKYN